MQVHSAWPLAGGHKGINHGNLHACRLWCLRIHVIVQGLNCNMQTCMYRSSTEGTKLYTEAEEHLTTWGAEIKWAT